MFLNPFGLKPYKSRLSLEEYEHIKKDIASRIERQLAFDMGVPNIKFNDKYRHIVLLDFNGCVMDDTIVIPDGVTLVYVTDEEANKVLLPDKKYNLVLADTVQYIDSLPALKYKALDTNKLEAFRLNNIRLSAAFSTIDTVIIRDSLRQEKCVGHFWVKNLFYQFENEFKLTGNQVFLLETGTNRPDISINPANIYINSNCKKVSLGKRLAVIHGCTGEKPMITLKANKYVTVGTPYNEMEEELQKCLEGE